MKICFVNTAATGSKRLLPHWTPLGLSYIAAALEKKGHEARIIERDVIFRRKGLSKGRTDRAMMEKVKAFRPDMVGISSPTELFRDAAGSAALIKRAFPHIPVIYGGHHGTAVPEEVMEASRDIDMVVAGEGEQTMSEIAEGKGLDSIRGLTYRRDGSIVSNPGRNPVEKLDEIPMPARHLLDMDFHTRPSHLLIRNMLLSTTTMLTSRGCPFNCSFCVESLPFGKRHRFHSPSRVLEELDHILTNYPIEGIYFLDEGFLANRKRVEELCTLLIGEGYHRRIKWAAQVRVDSIDPDILGLMREAGCVQLECGFETGSDRLLHGTGKGTSSAKNLEVLNRIHDSGIKCMAYIIVGLPGETDDDLNDTLRFLKTSGADYITLSRFTPHPGSALYNELVAKGQLEKGFWKTNWGLYAGRNFTSMPDRVFNSRYKEVQGEVRKINERNRMLQTSILKRIKSASFSEVSTSLLFSPETILKFLLNWLSTKLLRRTIW